jgi:hypothetical protein
MKCPHCTVEIHPSFVTEHIAAGEYISREGGHAYSFEVATMSCPSCRKAIVNLRRQLAGPRPGSKIVESEYMVYPQQASRPPAPAEVPEDLAQDFNEACAVLALSPKASAALSRRCLQELLRQQGFTQHDLAKAIDAVLAKNVLPAALAENLDAVRNIGNFAAHPIKDTASGTVVPVEDHEADWNLDVLEGLFDYYYVRPAKDKARRVALDAKLAAAGKPPMKA